MKRFWNMFITMLLAISMLYGCATPFNPMPRFDAQAIPDGAYDKKVDHLVFILDSSSSMNEGAGGFRKFDVARSVVDNFNATMPGLDVQFSLYSFGHDAKVSKSSSALMIKPRAYMQEVVSGGMKKFVAAGGSSPLGRAIDDAAAGLSQAKGPIALVIVSDGQQLRNSPLAAAEALAASHSQLCIHTVQVGDDTAGAALLQKIASVGDGCGSAVNAADLSSGAAMAGFVKDVALTQSADSDGDGVPDGQDQCPGTPRGVQVDANGCPVDSDGDGVADFKDKCANTPAGVAVDASGCPLDSDGDGVYDYKDQCPGTARGTKVDAVGCPEPMATKSAEVTAAGTWLYKDIQFEVNKADLKQSSYPILDEITEALKAQPNLSIEVQGHTDSTGAYNYNVDLSQRRARSVAAYLQSQGIAASRMTAKGYGPDRPIAGNDTKEGRARNRRVEIKPIQ